MVEVEQTNKNVFLDIQDFCFKQMNHDPSTSARVLAEIEQNDKTVFFDAPGGVVAPTPTRFERKQTQRKGRKFKPDGEGNHSLETESFNNSR